MSTQIGSASSTPPKPKLNYVLCWLATADASGRPSVSPKEIFWIDETTNHVFIAAIASPRSVRNIQYNPNVCVSMIDVVEQKGIQVFGLGRVVKPEDYDFAEVSKKLAELAGPRFPIKAVIDIAIKRTQPIQAPSLWMYPQDSAEQRRQSALEAYGFNSPSSNA